MSYLSMGLLIAFIVVFIWIKRDDKRKWYTVYEAGGNESGEAQQKLNYLRRKGIHCRLKNDTGGTIRSMVMGGQMSKQLTVRLQVHKEETDQAFKHLADFNK